MAGLIYQVFFSLQSEQLNLCCHLVAKYSTAAVPCYLAWFHWGCIVAFSQIWLWKIKWNICFKKKKRLCPICFIIPLVWHVYLISLWGSIKRFISFDSCITPGHQLCVDRDTFSTAKWQNIQRKLTWKPDECRYTSLDLDLALWHIQKKKKKSKSATFCLHHLKLRFVGH